MIIEILPFYQQLTDDQDMMRLDRIRKWAFERLELLYDINRMKHRSLEEITTVIKPKIRLFLPYTSPGLLAEHQIDVNYIKDVISHCTLRFVLWRLLDLSDMFLACESTLFQVRYSMLTATNQRKVALENKLPWPYASKLEQAAVADQVMALLGAAISEMYPWLTQEALLNFITVFEQIIKVPFEEVPEMIGLRLVFLKKGVAYVPLSFEPQLMAIFFKNTVKGCIQKMMEKLGLFYTPHLLLAISRAVVRQWRKFHEPLRYTNTLSTVPSAATNVFLKESQIHFPLCIKQIFARGLYKYADRKQLAFFLLGAQVPLVEAQQLWQELGLELYYINHLYGEAGNLTVYQPMPCSTIIRNSSIRNYDYGCPFKTNTDSQLTKELEVFDIEDLPEVLADRLQENHTLACSKVLVRNQRTSRAKVFYPHQYFRISKQMNPPP